MNDTTAKVPITLRTHGTNRQGFRMERSKTVRRNRRAAIGIASVVEGNDAFASIGKQKDISGMKYGDWTVIRFCSKDKKGQSHWFAVCSCGAEKVVRGSSLTSGNSKSCGHQSRLVAGERLKTHGMSNTRIFRLWCGMRQRCNDKNHSAYKDYGARGIKVCDRWNDSFENFYSDMGDRQRGKSLNRIDNDGNYEPSNCCWSSKKDQARNTRSNNLISINSETKCLAEWSELVGVPAPTIRYRLRNGWTKERALYQPVRASRHSGNEAQE